MVRRKKFAEVQREYETCRFRLRSIRPNVPHYIRIPYSVEWSQAISQAALTVAGGWTKSGQNISGLSFLSITRA